MASTTFLPLGALRAKLDMSATVSSVSTGQPLTMKGRLHQTALAQPKVAVTGQQIFTGDRFEQAVAHLGAPIVFVVINQNVFDKVGLKEGIRVARAKAQLHYVAILVHGAQIKIQRVALELGQYTQRETTFYRRQV